MSFQVKAPLHAKRKRLLVRIILINYLKKTFIKNIYDKSHRIKSLFRFINRIILEVTRNTSSAAYFVNSYRDYLRSSNPKRMIDLKDVHLGDMCFVIGNGPSLSASDLDKIKEFTTFGSNYIFEMNNFLPTYYFVQDFLLLKNKQFLNKIREVSHNTSFTFLPFNIISNKQKKYINNVIYFYLSRPNDNSRKFSFDLSQNVEEGHTVTYTILQFAVYMGFKKIFILGVDNTTSGHFYDADTPNEVYLQPNEVTNNSYQYLKSVLPSNVEIVNCTRGGSLEVFERMSLEQVISNLK